jgi:outer membrane protein assembly factor BamB
MISARRLRPLPLLLLALAVSPAASGCTFFAPRESNRLPELEIGRRPVLQQVWATPLVAYRKLWQYHPQEFGVPEVDPVHGRVFVGNRVGWVFAVDTATGAVLWRTELSGAISGQPRYIPEHDALLVGSDDGGLYRLNGTTGKEKWRYVTKGTINSRPLLHEGLVYAMNTDEYLYAVDFETGVWRWHYHREPPDQFTVHGVSSPVAAGGRIYVGFGDGYLVALSPRDGGVLWARYLAAGKKDLVDVDATPLWLDGKLYVSSYAGGVSAVDAADGHVIWSLPVEGPTSVTSDGERLYVAAPRRGLHCLDMSGQLLWRQAIGEGTPTTPTVFGPLVAFTVGDQGLYVADKMTGELRELINPGEGYSAGVARHQDQLYVLSNQGTLYAYRLLVK